MSRLSNPGCRGGPQRPVGLPASLVTFMDQGLMDQALCDICYQYFAVTVQGPDLCSHADKSPSVFKEGARRGALKCISNLVHSYLQQVPYIQIVKLRTYKDVNVRSRVQSPKFVHVSGVHCHVRASSSGCAFVYFAVRHSCCTAQGAH